MDLSRQHSNRIPHVPQLTIESDASNIGWGARQGDLTTGGVWSKEEATHHINYLELLAAFLAVRCFAREQHQITILLKLDSITAMTYINKMVTASVSIGPLLMGVVSAEGDILSSSASARERECSGRSGVQNSEGSLRLDAEPQCIQANSSTNGSLRGGFVCISPNQTTTTVLQLEAGSRSRGSGCVQSGLVSSKGFCQPSVVPDSSLPGSVKEALQPLKKGLVMQRIP